MDIKQQMSKYKTLVKAAKNTYKTPDGKIFLDAMLAYALMPSFHSDPITMARNEGIRHFALEIQSLLQVEINVVNSQDMAEMEL